MNKIFKTLWNCNTQSIVVTSELAKGKVKSSTNSIEQSNFLLKVIPFDFKLKSLLSAMIALGLMTYSYNVSAWNYAYGDGAQANRGQSIAIGQAAKANGDQSVALGSNTDASGNASIAVGGDDTEQVKNKRITLQNGKADTIDNILHTASGVRLNDGGTYQATKSEGHGSIAIGPKAVSKGHLSTAIGISSRAEGILSLAFGAGAVASKDNSIALGPGSSTKTDAVYITDATIKAIDENGNESGEITYKNFAGGSANLSKGDQVSVGSVGFERQIKNVAAGKVTTDSTDAINGSQLASVASRLQNLLDKNQTDQDQGLNITADNYLDNLSNKDNLQLGDTITFTSSDSSVITGVGNDKIDFKVNKETLSVNNGVVNNVTNTNTYATAKTVAETINNSGFKVTGNGVNTTDIINPGNTIDFINGNVINATVTNTADKSTIKYDIQVDNTTIAIEGGRLVSKVADTNTQNTVKAGSNINILNKNNLVGGTEYTINAEDTVVSAGDGITVTSNLDQNNVDTYTVQLNDNTKTKLDKADSALQNIITKIDGTIVKTLGIKATDGNVANFVTGKNIVLSNQDDSIKVATAEQVEFTKTTIGRVIIDAATNKITGLEAGTADTDAVNLAQLTNQLSGSSWKIAGTDKSAVGNGVNPNEQVNFINGVGTTSQVVADGDNYNVSFDVVKSTLSSQGGMVSADTTGDAFATAENVAKIINDSGFKLTTSASTGVVEDSSEELVNPGETITIDAGSNVKVTQAGGKITVESEDTTVSAGEGLEIEENLTAGAGVDNYKVKFSAETKKALSDAKAGFNIAADNGTTDTVQLTDTIKYTSTDNNIKTTVTDNQIDFELQNTVVIGKDKSVTLNGNEGTITGLSNTTFDPNTIYTGGQAATQEQLSSVSNSPLTITGNTLSDTSGNGTEQKLGSTLEISGGATAASSNGNVKTVITDNKVDIQLLDAPTFAGKVSAKGLDAGDQKVTGVAVGEVAAGSTDAVNGNQLNDVLEEAKRKTKLVDGTGTTVAGMGTEADPYKVNIETSDLTKNDVGTVTVDTTKPNSIATAGSVAEAINNSGFNVNSGNSGTGEVEGNTKKLVKTGEQVTFNSGNNLKLVQNDKDFTYSLKDKIELEEVKIINGPTIDTTGIDVANKKITNVVAGTVGAGSKDAVNGDQLFKVASNPLTFTGDEGASTQKLGSTFEIVAGNATGTSTKNLKTTVEAGKVIISMAETPIFSGLEAGGKITGVEAGTEATDAVNLSQLESLTVAATSKVESADKEKVQIDKIDNDDGSKTYKVNIITADLTPNADGTVTPENSNSLSTSGDIAEAINNSGFKLTTSKSDGTVAGTTEEKIQNGEIITIDAGKNINVTQKGNEISLATNTVVEFDKATVGSVVIDSGTNTISGLSNTTFDPTVTYTGGKSATQEQLSQVANSPLTFTGDEGATTQKLDSTFEIVAGNATGTSTKNLKTTVEAGKVIISMAETPIFNGLEAGGKITGVEAGTEATDAVNLSQLESLTVAATSKVESADKEKVQIDKIDNDDGSKTYQVNVLTSKVAIKDDGKVEAATPTSLTTAGDVASAINNSSFKVTTTTGTGTKDQKIKAGETVKFEKGANIELAQVDNAFTYSLSKDLTGVNAITGDSGNKIELNNADGVKLSNNAKPVKLTGIAAGNVAKGSTDAVNGDQLVKAQVAATTKVDSLDEEKISVTAIDNADGSKTYKLNVKTSDITSNEAGEAIVANPNSLATAGALAEVINNVSWTTEAGIGVDGGEVSGKTTEKVKVGEKVIFDAGKNLKLIQDGQKYTYSLKNKVEVAEVKITNGPIINATGIDAADKKVKNVVAGTEATDAVNLSQLESLTVAATSKVESADKEKVQIDKIDNDDGSKTYQVNVLTSKVAIKDDGKVEAATPTSLTTAGDVASAINNSSFKVTTTTGTGTKDQKIKTGETVKFEKGANIELAQVDNAFTYSLSKDLTGVNAITGDSGNKIELNNADGVKLSNNAKPVKLTGIATGNIVKGSTDAVNGSQLFDVSEEAKKKTKLADGTGTKVAGTGTAIDPYKVNIEISELTETIDGMVTADTSRPDSIATAASVVAAINNSGFNVNSGKSGTGEVEGNSKTLVKTSEAVTFNAGDNLKLVQNGKDFTYSLKNKVELNEVKITDGPIINGTGIDVADKKITGIGDGDISPTSKDAVNGAQLYAITGGNKSETKDNFVDPNTNNQYNDVVVDNDGNPLLKTYNVRNQQEYIENSVYSAIHRMNEEGIKFFHVNDGKNADTSVDQTSNSIDASAKGSYSAAIGYKAKATGENSVALGNRVESAESSVAIGDSSQATGIQSVAIGTRNVVSGNHSGAIGDPNIVTGNSSYALGNNNHITTSNTFALGNDVTNTVGNSVFLGNNVGFVKAKTNSDGTLDERNSSTAGMAILSQQIVEGGLVNKYAGGQEIVGVVSVGNVDKDTGKMQTRRIQNIAPALISKGSTDAVNGSQLYSIAKGLQTGIDNLSNRVGKLDQRVRGIGASSAAAASLPQVYIPGKSMVAAAVGGYESASAISVGYSRASDNGKVILKLQGSVNSEGHASGGVGVGYQW
ncbi:trimeric autotransporter adhesin [Bisgaardia hudsonensis]|uniref:Trimeric autotransporter adhesin n=1 Tax=Bisgaardia hudsonensis TaxID=109472 RepID=A0A4R2N322_9PAST|nr:YadA-like family protein [Bisgaardia hudsonensis]QLB12727.1 hypothetical protein A6A11_03460 [Bisgaardia hudsonensis]TCP14278.1 trimeric autotransporter adhesin [Bisgaardia hudsonensis]